MSRGFSFSLEMRKVWKTVQKEIQRVIAKREVNSYKGDFGRLLLIVLISLWGAISGAAVHSGAGLAQQILIP